MTTRRGLFKLLAGALASPALAPLVKFLPESRFGGFIPGFDYVSLGRLRSNLPMTQMFKTISLPSRMGNSITFFTYVPLRDDERHT
jgi:hypothetical protein